MKYVLGIQTAELPNSLALINNGGKFIKEIQINKEGHTVELLRKFTRKICEKSKVSLNDVKIISVCLGPGSYTGTRGGLAFAKGFCQFSDKQIVGVSAFDVLERSIKEIDKYKDVIFIQDARNNRVYYKYRNREDVKVSSIEKVIDEVNSKTLFIGSGVRENRNFIEKRLKNNSKFIKDELNVLSAEKVAYAGLDKYKNESSIYNENYLYKLEPLYILPPNITKSKRK